MRTSSETFRMSFEAGALDAYARIAGSILMTDYDFTNTVREHVDIALRK